MIGKNMKNSPQLSIVMPCLNEAETLETCIKKAQHFLASHKIVGEIIVADNGSIDGSQEIAARAGARVVSISQKGYGSALMGGIEAARGEFIIMGDADDSYDFSNLQNFVNALNDGYDLVMGNRFKGGIIRGAMPFLHRYLGNPVLSRLGRLFFKIDISDFHCGLRGFRKDAILALGLQTIGMEFASEMIVQSSLQGLKITEVPTILYPDGRTRPPHLRTWSDGWRHLRFLLLFSPRWLFYYPGIFLMAIGCIISIWLLPGPRVVGSITLDINTLLYSAFTIILGLQTTLFYLYTRVFGASIGFLPKDTKMERLLGIFNLEKGLMIGTLTILLGIASSVGAILYWGRTNFGNLEPMLSMRLVIPGTVMFAIGFQVLFSSFFFSILATKRKETRGVPPLS
jgi:glycosyltransferase involved in cell wall biosynthesis